MLLKCDGQIGALEHASYVTDTLPFVRPPGLFDASLAQGQASLRLSKILALPLLHHQMDGTILYFVASL
jgi:hypothetical protein